MAGVTYVVSLAARGPLGPGPASRSVTVALPPSSPGDDEATGPGDEGGTGNLLGGRISMR